VRDELKDSGSDRAAASRLWRRAPIWRTALVAALLTSAAGIYLATQPSSGPDASRATAAPQMPQTAPTPPPTDPSAAGQSQPAPAAPSSSPSAPVATTQSSEEEEEQNLAACHPGLIQAPPMPQIDIANVAAPNLAHIKYHFWVNGAGSVVRVAKTAANYGTPQEWDAEQGFISAMRFSVPQTQSCRVREMELIGDVFETRDKDGRWLSYIRLYPRVSFAPGGALQRRD
jgi:hypothetical protein